MGVSGKVGLPMQVGYTQPPIPPVSELDFLTVHNLYISIILPKKIVLRLSGILLA
jgi:hypothetical protein